MTPLAALIAEEIGHHGPMRFDRFMELALYHPLYGYYTRADRDPFGKQGDFFTASQMQPVFGQLIARAIRALRAEMGEPEDFRVVELGPGRGEMAQALQEFDYQPVEVGASLPENITGVVFSNEFFDALPVRLLERRAHKWHERLVTVGEHGFAFTTGGAIQTRLATPQAIAELHDVSLQWMNRIAGAMRRGFVLTIDYGFTARETLRFPQGTLMSYHNHVASDDVLSNPGERDVTSHVPFDALREEGEAAGLETVRLETLLQFAVRLGESDQFAEFVQGGGENALKTLIYGMGESFRVLLQRKR